MVRICCIIPTKDRPVDIKNVLESIQRQTLLPDEVIIIDGSDNPVKNVVDELNYPWVNYNTLRPPGLARQKNFGIKLALEKGYDWIGFLDDDLVLEETCIESLAKEIQQSDSLSGIGLAINNQPIVKHTFIKKMFMLDDDKGGHFTASGCPTQIRAVQNTQQVDWVYGGATFWAREVLEQYKFDEWFSGVGYFEDVDFSYRVSRQKNIIISGKARCWHYHHATPKSKLAILGQWHFTAWWYFCQKYKNFNPLLTLYAMSSLTFLNFINSLKNRNSHGVLTAKGNVKGLLRILTGNYKSLKGFQK